MNAMKRSWVKLRFYFWRTLIDQALWAGLFGSWIHTRALLGFTRSLEDGMSCGWLSAQKMTDAFCEACEVPEDP